MDFSCLRTDGHNIPLLTRQFHLGNFWECWSSSFLVNVWKTDHEVSQTKKGAGSPISLGRILYRWHLGMKVMKGQPESLVCLGPRLSVWVRKPLGRGRPSGGAGSRQALLSGGVPGLRVWFEKHRPLCPPPKFTAPIFVFCEVLYKAKS